MKPKMAVKIGVDLGMTVLLLLLMAYELIGQAAHEWLGVGMLVLFLLHHILNGKWLRGIFKGSYRAMRILQTVLAASIFLSMLGSMVSGVILSRHVFAFLPIEGGRAFARSLHMVCGYGGFVLMSFHLGIHWAMMLGIAGKHTRIAFGNSRWKWLLRGMGAAIAAYGAYAFVKREIGSYIFWKNQFVFFDFEEPLFLFLLDYLAVMGLFVFAGHYISLLLKRKKKLSL